MLVGVDGIMQLSKEAEKRLFGAVDQLLVDLDGEQDPNLAIARAMREHCLGPGFAPLLSAAYNVGRALDQQESEGGLLHKLAAFPLADPAEVLENLFPEAEGTPADQHRREVVSEDYLRPPAGWSLLQAKAGVAKSASGVGCRRKAKSPSQPARKASPAKQAEAGWKAARALDRFHRALGRVVDYFRQPAWRREKFASVCSWSEWRWGKPALALLRYVPTQVKLSKEAELDDRRDPDFERGPYPLIAEALQCAEGLVEFRPAIPPPAPPPPPSPILRKEATGLGDIFGGAIGGFISTIANQLGARVSTPQKVDYSWWLSELFRPEQERLRDSLDVRSALAEFAANDPVISGYKEDEIVRAYNELAKQAPRVMRYPSMMRSYMRKYLTQGGLETFEAGELQKLEQEYGRPLATSVPRFMGLGDQGNS